MFNNFGEKFQSLIHFQSLSLKAKLQIFIIIISAITITPILIYVQMKNTASMISTAKDQMVSLREINKKRIELFSDNSVKFSQNLSQNRLIQAMYVAFESSFYADGFSVGKDLDINSKSYKAAEEEYQKSITDLMNVFNFDNILLANQGGQIIFSVKKDAQHPFLGKNLESGSLSQTSLATCFKNAKKNDNASEIHFADYEIYPGTSFVSAFLCVRKVAEFDMLAEGLKKGDLLGVTISQIDVNYINGLIQDRSGMGETGQIYLVGIEGKLRTDMFVNKEQYNVNNSFQRNLLISTASFTQALYGNSEVHEIKDVSNHNVISAYAPVSVFGQHWGLMAEKSVSEIMQPVYKITRQVILNALVVLAIVMLIAYLFGRTIINPILRISRTLNNSSHDLNKASEELSDASNKLSSSSNQQAAATQESVAAMQEMASMINQTADFSHKSKDISDLVKGMTAEGDKIMRNMVDSMTAINKENENMRGMVDVIKNISKKTTVINDIVFKTQLLSFNASIEAARAGQHGKGFAVVAEEVGNLANMSGNAAREIYSLLENSQKKVNEAVKSTEETVKRGQDVTNKAQAIFRQIADNIGLINEQIQRIVDATNEQSKGVLQTESALKQLDDSAKSNSDVAVRAQNNSSQLQKAKNELNKIIANLNQIVLGSETTTEISIHDHKEQQAVNSTYVDPQLLDGIIAKKDSLNDQDFEKMNE